VSDEGQFWLKRPGGEWQQVTMKEWVIVERGQGFVNTMGRPDLPATSSFTGSDGTTGQTWKPRTGFWDSSPVEGFDPNHHYYDHLGNKITLEEWAANVGDPERKKLRETQAVAGIKVVTVYLGFVVPDIYDARLFGTALFVDGKQDPLDRIQQVEVHDSEVDALQRHFAHVEAVREGHHCQRCREGKSHVD
jgi:hypothetical protein